MDKVLRSLRAYWLGQPAPSPRMSHACELLSERLVPTLGIESDASWAQALGQLEDADLKSRLEELRKRDGAAGLALEELEGIIEPWKEFGLRVRTRLGRPGKRQVFLWLADRAGEPCRYGPVDLNDDVARIIDFYWKEVNREKRPLGKQGSVTPEIRDLGSQLYQAVIGPELGRALWERHAHNRSLMILSDEPSIPWEIIVLPKPGNPSGAAELFFCEVFDLVRWLILNQDAGKRRYPPLDLSLGRIALVAPRTSGLKNREQEIELISSLRPGCVELIPAEYETILEKLKSGQFDTWHFCGHGILEGDSSLDGFPLDDEKSLRAGSLVHCGAFSQRRPLVFMNGCYTGRIADSIATLEGWPAAFLQAGAGAFVGSIWEVSSGEALKFAETFYRGFLGGSSFSQAISKARENRFKLADPTRLAYVAYGHPHATCRTLAAEHDLSESH